MALTTSAWTSTSSGRWPSRVGSTTEPATSGARSARNSRLGSSTDHNPSPPISNRPTSSLRPNLCLTTRSIRRAWWRSPVNSRTVSTTCSRSFGPAREPSLVTWPTRRVAMPRAFASTTRRWAHPRTWPAEPGAPASATRCTVWMESTMRRSGSRRSAWARIASTDASPASQRSSSTAPRRSARSRTWDADSSALTNRTRPPARTRAAASCRVKVDLPIPGSPPRSVTEPGTRPPPRHRSASAMPVGTVVAAPDSSAVIGCTSPSCATPAIDARVSSSEFQAEHELQRPTHFAWGAAHDPQV